jgi:hypothetical protein
LSQSAARHDVARPVRRPSPAARRRLRLPRLRLPRLRPAQGVLRPSQPVPQHVSPPKVRRVRAGTPPYERAPRTGGPSAMSPPYAQAPSRRSTASISAVTPRHPRAEPRIKAPCPLRAPARAARRHCHCRPVLELAARARRRSTTLVAPLGSSEASALANCPAPRLLAGFPRATAATAAGRC